MTIVIKYMTIKMYEQTAILVLEQIYLNEGIHKREIARKLKISMPSVANSIKKIKEVLKLKTEGNQHKYFLDYSKPFLTPFLEFVEQSRIKKLPTKARLAIFDFLKELREKPIIALVFGSYAKNNYNENSDIDILLVYQMLENTKYIENTAKKISMANNIIISPVYLDYVSFKESFYNNSKEFFRNIKKDKILLAGIEWWRQLKNAEN